MLLCVSRLAILMGAAKTVAAMTDATAMNEKRICVLFVWVVARESAYRVAFEESWFDFELVVDDRTKTEDEEQGVSFIQKKMELTFNNEKCEMNVSVTAQYASSRSGHSHGEFA